MIKEKKILVVGAGGFIGGHLVRRLLKLGNSIIAVDIKPKEYWFQDIENNKAECMQSVLINTNLLISCKENKIEKYFFSSSACAYNTSKQKEVFIEGLKEEDAYPANPEDGYGWEKLFSERMCRHFMEDYKLPVRVARYHNIYGPYGTFDGGREKAPAAMCRKVIKAKKIMRIELKFGATESKLDLFYIQMTAQRER